MGVRESPVTQSPSCPVPKGNFIHIARVKHGVAPIQRILRTTIRLASVLLAASVALILSSYLYGDWYAARTEAAQREVWEAYFNEAIRSEINDSPDQPVPQSEILLQGHTQQAYRHYVLAMLWPAWALSKSAPLSRLPELQAGTYVHYLLGSLRSHPIGPGLNLPFAHRLADQEELATYGEDWDRWDSLFPGSSDYFVLSTVGFNSDLTQALLYVEHICGLCGGGGYVLLRKVDDHWIVEAEASTWVS